MVNYQNNDIVVDFEDNIRRLFVGGQCQGRMNIDGTPASEYMKEICIFIEGRKDTYSVLVIGGGAFIMPGHLYRLGLYIEVVEPDEELMRLAGIYFKPNANKIYKDKAQDIIDSLDKYGIIVLDAYIGNDPVPEIYNEAFYAKCFDHLNDNGVLITNDTRHGYSKVQYYVKEKNEECIQSQ